MCGEQLSEVMSLVIRVVNFIVARALHDRQFKALLDEVGNANPGLLLHSNVRWLSRGKVQAELASQHKWTEIKKIPHADDLIVKTWNALPVTYSTLQRVSVAVLTMFGSTYACEQSFSHIKTNLRSRLTDESLNACMKLKLTAYQPDYKAI
ncbi:General transcription factor II-I repeat domain-containing protein 2-like, partial [Caligus rogercresseyi]